ncbi:23S rRNA (uracil(1939)-C(5))-methyltransferase RlmD [Ferroacidibacillus organovorans]|uniref:TRAM domain-containing protein n=1 Tax=Ferroacidibacillus organovorans TaxID=1765683 RepID=A0A853KBH2_9BACL|nr:23S rRNA (uracil(1939)-C(5))-methyltransferase RlmD [Ferroacidibacillus organovorans]KYP82071.1 hypothetical protein AYJ22_05065 [Ferroacidibacillus organovorans]OAG94392.1 hypothetical protein AYW79_05890 [Ferroacidibacillus organovorans]
MERESGRAGGRRERTPGASVDGRRERTPARAVPVRLGQTYEVVIDRLGFQGEGVARVEGFTVFVPGALIGERVTVRMERVERSFARAVLLQVVEAAAERVLPRCSVYAECGGCNLQHMSAEAQLRMKKQTVLDALERIGRFPKEDVRAWVRDVIPSPNVWQYRNKVTWTVSVEDGRFAVGFVEEGSHDPVDTDDCAIVPEHVLRIVRAMRRVDEAVRGADLSAASPERGDDTLAASPERGDDTLAASPGQGAGTSTAMLSPWRGVHHVRVRTNGSAEVLIALLVETGVVFSPEDVRLFRNELEAQRVKVVGLIADDGVAERVMFGQPQMEERIAGLTFGVSSRSFMQVNPAQAERLYAEALALAGLTGTQRVWDIYAGIGTLTLMAGRQADSVVGVEIVEEAVSDAQMNIERNGMHHVRMMLGDAQDVVSRLAEDEHPDVVFLDPPRAGCEKRVLDAICDAAPARIVYVSCNPATLARDLRILADRGYAVDVAQPLDMFPQTSHVECVVSTYRVD